MMAKEEGNVSYITLTQEEADKWAVEDLAKSCVTMADMGIEKAELKKTALPNIKVKASDGTEQLQNLSVWVEAWYPIHYFYPNGEMIPDHYTKKLKFKLGAPEEATNRKYIRPSKAAAGALALIPYLHPARLDLKEVAVLDLHEGEKKAACAAVNCGQYPVGIGGCDNWIDPESDKRRRKIHPWIVGEIEAVRAKLPKGVARPTVRIWPDGDLLRNPDVRAAYTRLVTALRKLDVDIKIMDLSPFRKEGEVDIPKFDDLVNEIGYDELMAKVGEIQQKDLGEDPEALAREYGLMTEMHGPKDNRRPLPMPNFENVATLLELHPQFRDSLGEPVLWTNSDLARRMYGDRETLVNKDDGDVLRYFQRQLGFAGTGRTITLPLVQSGLSYTYAQNVRSPFRERVRRAVEALKARGAEAIKAADEKLNSWAVDYLYANPANPFSRVWARGLMLAVVGRGMRPGCDMRTAFVIAGPQNTGKTGFARSLVGKENVAIIREENGSGKDLAMTYAGCIVAVHDEMEAMNARRVQAVKADISAPEDRVRLPYDKDVSTLPRHCVFLIPVDKHEFLLGDAAGLTRFAVLNLHESPRPGERFDFEGLAAAADDLLAAAWIAIEAGEKFDTVEGADASAQIHVKPDALMEAVEAAIDFAVDHRKGVVRLHRGKYRGVEIVGVVMRDICAYLNIDSYRGGAGEAIGNCLRKLGFEYSGDNEPLKTKRLWFAEATKFDQKFKGGRDEEA